MPVFEWIVIGVFIAIICLLYYVCYCRGSGDNLVHPDSNGVPQSEEPGGRALPGIAENDKPHVRAPIISAGLINAALVRGGAVVRNAEDVVRIENTDQQRVWFQVSQHREPDVNRGIEEVADVQGAENINTQLAETSNESRAEVVKNVNGQKAETSINCWVQNAENTDRFYEGKVNEQISGEPRKKNLDEPLPGSADIYCAENSDGSSTAKAEGFHERTFNVQISVITDLTRKQSVDESLPNRERKPQAESTDSARTGNTDVSLEGNLVEQISGSTDEPRKQTLDEPLSKSEGESPAESTDGARTRSVDGSHEENLIEQISVSSDEPRKQSVDEPLSKSECEPRVESTDSARTGNTDGSHEIQFFEQISWSSYETRKQTLDKPLSKSEGESPPENTDSARTRSEDGSHEENLFGQISGSTDEGGKQKMDESVPENSDGSIAGNPVEPKPGTVEPKGMLRPPMERQQHISTESE